MALDEHHEHGTYVAPTVIEIDSIAQLKREVFGPVLHVLRYRRDQLPQLIDTINASGYGLTLGVHSRIDETIAFVADHAHVGNIYVNRNIVGAVVGVQPFGGEGKSGTGPKAGGPLYLKRLQRHAEVKLFSDATPAASEPLKSLLDWAATHGHAKLAQLGATYVQESLLNKTLTLPGPTGERNTLSFAPRGKILCAAADVAALLNQIAAVLATGNTAVVPAAQGKLIPAGLPAEARQAIELSGDVAALDLHLALVDAPVITQWRGVLAARDGALVPLVPTAEDMPIALWRLVAERALCVNTTAAGGNASLMTLSV